MYVHLSVRMSRFQVRSETWKLFEIFSWKISALLSVKNIVQNTYTVTLVCLHCFWTLKTLRPLKTSMCPLYKVEQISTTIAHSHLKKSIFQDQITPNSAVWLWMKSNFFKLFCMFVINTSNFDNVSINYEQVSTETAFYKSMTHLLDSQGQPNSQSAVGSDRNIKSSKLLWRFE